MLFMNEWEIDQSVVRHAKHPVLSKATKLLYDLKNLVNQHSDGWAYWRAPVKAAAKLMALIETPELATEADLKRAMTPIKSFCTRHKLTFPCSTTQMKLRDPSSLLFEELADIIRRVQTRMFRDDDGNIDLDHSISGADFIDFVTMTLEQHGLTPQA